MGCASSVYVLGRKKKAIIPEVVVFVPSVRIPVQSDLQTPLKALIPRELLDRLASLRNQIVFDCLWLRILMLAIEKDKILVFVDGSAITELLRALEDYLSLSFGLTKKVKRRLACELLIYFSQAYQCLSGCDMNYVYGKKHLWFIKWKFLEWKAAAYYYHGLILDKGNEPSCHVSAVCCFLAAEELQCESKTFCLAAPITRSPPLWGAMKH
ncbi:hypothetical protein Ddye_004547 [Dipteronia dyeriana]|uniref:Uncharacterized protein n=1 Tax=Dipteronia dyeriana TaxID=168575 RepID=A0AAD9XV63_9ROSI|nr:hypothetical protein Ddye_004547 [Dipteronia dyeriana]